MQAITTFRTSVDSKFSDLSSRITTMHTTLSAVTGKVRVMEDSLNDHSDKITALESLYDKLVSKQNEHHKKLDDLESRSRRQNRTLKEACSWMWRTELLAPNQLRGEDHDLLLYGSFTVKHVILLEFEEVRKNAERPICATAFCILPDFE
ncbi:hypothetical protein WMY93_023277 [Mugilogobius chulae]|uniref:Uncharacterized protein n=1 Tax=Mugilogobius chulae TaxID=88201 RepID=A0AAW0N3V3_9GOBI